MTSTEATRAVPEAGYRQGLSIRMIRMMAIGGMIGTGLFYGTGSAIHQAGPGLLVAFAVAGLAVFVIARALGEMLDHRPTSGSLYEYPREFLGPFAGFLCGWTYWATVSVSCMAEVTAAGKYLQFWWPQVPVWATALGCVALVVVVNLFSVRAYGESEFWFAALKVAAVLALIGFGCFVLSPIPELVGLSEFGGRAGADVANLWQDGGFFPNGAAPVLMAAPLALFAYAGVEQVGLVAGEAQDSKRTLRRAVNSIPLRIALCYLGVLAVLLCVRGWRSYQPGQSPFVTVFHNAGLHHAADVLNAVVLTAAFSSCNSSMYSTARLLRAIALRGEGARWFGGLSARAVPARATLFSASVVAVGVGANVLLPQTAWTALISLAVVGLILVWGSILGAHTVYRRRVADGRSLSTGFRLPLAPWSTAFAGLVLAVVLVEQGFSVEGRVALAVGTGWVALVAAGHWALRQIRASEDPAPLGGGSQGQETS